MKIIALLILPLFLTSCSLLQKKVNSEVTYSASGFEYNFPKTGEWFVGNAKPGNIIIGKKPEDDGTSVLATVRSGPMGITTKELEELKKNGSIKAHKATEVIASFKANVENDAKQGPVKNIKTKYEEKKYDLGSCLIFSQTGIDQGARQISNEGKWCFNSKSYSYIMLNLSARVPEGKTLPDFTSEKNEYFDSLVFTEK
jgi:hypothetical protein